MPSVASRLALLAGSLALSLVSTEFWLRATQPRFEYAAAASVIDDARRIWKRPADSRTSFAHPDRRRRHTVVYNNLGLRQHRDIAATKPDGERRIGFFGDSYTENLRLPAPYMFTEVLDYLFWLRGEPTTVLNFGVDGYGPDQSYLAWKTAAGARDLDTVVYVFSGNDIRNVYENGLFRLDEAGRLVERPLPDVGRGRGVLSRLYLTYFVRDAWQRLSGAREEDLDPEVDLDEAAARERAALADGSKRRRQDDTAERLRRDLAAGHSTRVVSENRALVRAVVARWRDEVEAEGGRFVVVLHPRAVEGAPGDLFEGFERFDLLPAALAEGAKPDELRFRRDGHWNETANQLAALHLYEYLAPSFMAHPLDRETLERELFVYYSAFERGWMPTRWVRATTVDEARKWRIVDRYVGAEELD